LIITNISNIIDIYGGRVANACNAGCHGFAPQLQLLFWDLFSRVDTVSGIKGLKMVCATLQELTMTSMITGKNYFVTEMGHYNKYWTKQCTHTTLWLVLDWVSIKEYDPCIRFRNDIFHVNIELHSHWHNLFTPPLYNIIDARLENIYLNWSTWDYRQLVTLSRSINEF